MVPGEDMSGGGGGSDNAKKWERAMLEASKAKLSRLTVSGGEARKPKTTEEQKVGFLNDRIEDEIEELEDDLEANPPYENDSRPRELRVAKRKGAILLSIKADRIRGGLRRAIEEEYKVYGDILEKVLSNPNNDEKTKESAYESRDAASDLCHMIKEIEEALEALGEA